MAIIVRYKPNGENYVLLGTGFGAYKSTRPGVFFCNLLPNDARLRHDGLESLREMGYTNPIL